MLQAAAPDWQAATYQNYACVLARVKINGVPIRSDGSLLAAFHGDEVRGVAEILGSNPDDDVDGEYYFSLPFGSNQSTEQGFTFKLWNSADNQIYDIEETLDFDINYPTQPEIYGGFTTAGFVPCIMNATLLNPVTYSITIENGVSNKNEALPGEEITITANAPADGFVFDRWTSSDVTIANATASTASFTMPTKNVTVTATYIALNPTVTYTLSPAAAVAAGARWKIDESGDWNDSGATVTTTVGNHTIYFKSVTGYVTPDSRTITLAAGEAKTGTVNYTPGESKYTLTLSGGKINNTSATTAQFKAGDIVTITANPPSSSQGLKIWTTSENVEFIGSVLGPTTTIRMPANDVTITADFIVKSSMQAVAVRSTTNTGDDTAKEPTSATSAVGDKGRFTFTRTSSSGALTVYYSIRGTAVNGTDYKSIASSVTFANGKTSVELNIEPLFDGIDENDETVIVVLEPATPTQTYRGGTYTSATITIEDTAPAPDDPTVEFTLSPAAAVAAGAKWKIDDGAWNDSGATVTTTVGTHTVSFKDVSGFVTPASQTITLATGETKIGNAVYDDGKYALNVVNGTINGSTASSARFAAGEEVSITATLPSGQGLKTWTTNDGAEFIGSVLGATTTIRMPANDVTVTASFIAKSSMPAVAVRSTTNEGDDSAKEPTSATATVDDKGRFTFTRTSSSGALTVYYSIRGTAVNGTDYKSIPSSVTFANGKASVEIEIEPLFDGLDEDDETVTVVLEPASPTQTYRGGAVTDATITIKDTPVVIDNPTVSITLYPSAVVTAGGQWKIDENGAWNDSGATVTTTVGTHTIYFKDVTNYTTPASQTITLVAGETKNGTATYVSSSIDDHYHPADCIVRDYHISGLEYLEYTGPVKAAALGDYEYEWDGADVLSLARKGTRGGAAPQTRGIYNLYPNEDGLSLGKIIQRQVSPAIYMEGSTVEVTLTIHETDKMYSLFIEELIPEGWTVVGAAADHVVNGTLRMTWDSPDIPESFTYMIQAPTENLAASYVIDSDTYCFVGATITELLEDWEDWKREEFLFNFWYKDHEGPIPDYEGLIIGCRIEPTSLIRNCHPADSNNDGKISGIEYLRYAAPVKLLALANDEYTWDEMDVFSIRKKESTRSGFAADDVMINRSVDTTTYEAGSQVAVTLTITGAENMVSLFIGETIPEGWTVVGDFAGNVKNGVLRMTWDAPNIPDTVTYTLRAPSGNLAPYYQIAGSSLDTGCFTDRVVFLTAGNTFLTLGQKPAEWPEDLALYAPADGRNFRESDNLAVTFSWPAILNAESYRLIVTTYDGIAVFDETLEETTCTVKGLERGSFIWNVTANGDGCIAGTIWQDFRFAVVPNTLVPIITGGTADGTAVRLAFDTMDANYKEGEIAYQVFFYSLENGMQKSLSQTLTVANGQAVIDLSVNASNGYLYIRPVTTPESDFTELYIK